MSKHVGLFVWASLLLGPAVVRTQPPPQSSEPAVPPSTAQQVMRFQSRCAICHDNPSSDSRAPSREALRQFTPERVLAALTTGSMAVNAGNMTDAEKRTMAELVTGKSFGGGAVAKAASS